MEANTKSSLFQEVSLYQIKTLLKKQFGTDCIWNASLVSGGLFNTTYKIIYGEKKETVILRLGPVNRHLILSFEQHLMTAEELFNRLLADNKIPCPHILCCDTTKSLIDRDYMFVEYIDGISMANADIAQKQSLYREIGSLTNQIHQITNSLFGTIYDVSVGNGYTTWSSFLISFVKDILQSCNNFSVFTEKEESRILNVFQKYQDVLDEITEPHLLHTDIWEGNIIIKPSSDKNNYQVAAIIDGDRAIWGDIDFELAAPWLNEEHFFEGYGIQKDASKQRTIRQTLYRIVYHLISSYVWIGEYNDKNLYESEKCQLLNLLKNL